MTMSLENLNIAVPNQTEKVIALPNDRSKSDDHHGDSSSRKTQEAVSQAGPRPATATTTSVTTVGTVTVGTAEDNSMRERLERHRNDVAGKVWIPEMWVQDRYLKDLIDCSAFDSSLASNSAIMSARDSLIEEGITRANARRLKIQHM